MSDETRGPRREARVLGESTPITAAAAAVLTSAVFWIGVTVGGLMSNVADLRTTSAELVKTVTNHEARLSAAEVRRDHARSQ